MEIMLVLEELSFGFTEMRYKFRVFHAGRTCFIQSLVFSLNHSEYCVSDREQGQKGDPLGDCYLSHPGVNWVEVPWLNAAAVETE